MRYASEVRHSTCEDDPFYIEIRHKVSHGYSRLWKQHLGMHQRRANLKNTTLTFLQNPKP